MSQDREHPDFDVLSDLLDGYLSKHDSEVVSEHLLACEACAETYTSLAGMVSSANALPKSVLPAEDLWIDLRKSLEDRKEVVLPRSSGSPSRDVGSMNGRRPSGRIVALLAVAALILIALSSGITALVLRNPSHDLAGRGATPTPLRAPTLGPGPVLPAGFRQTENEFNRTFKILRSLPCDVPLGDHPAQYDMMAKYAKLKAGAPNPFIDAANCWVEAEIQEAMLRAQVQMQQKAGRP